MFTTLPPTGVQSIDTTWRDSVPPSLSTIDRLALRVGVALILWGRAAALRAERREQAHLAGAAAAAERSRSAVAELRLLAGPVR
jgi:hypothetical protein